MSKLIRLGNRLRYPITIVKLLKSPGDRVEKQEPLMQFSFKWQKEVGDSIRGDTWTEEQTTIVNWDSPSAGDLKQWHIKEGQVIERDGPCFAIKEPCGHEVQFHGLCAMCGKDMTEANWAAETADTDRAPIRMVHDQTSLTVSQIQAQRTEKELQRRLLESRKLSLVVDLDQTIIQACIDPTIGEWMQDPTNPNYDMVKDIKVFQLNDGPRELMKRCWYYIKQRPGVQGFLNRMAEMYEMHVYTMGTRNYAKNVAHVVDPDKKLFGNRVISRDENGNITAKTLQRLFPVSTHMVVIIDDRSDVWPFNRPNLVKVSPYEFFKGTGDINSSFLPKQPDLLTTKPPAANGVSTKTDKKPLAPETSATAASSATAENGAESEFTEQQLEEQERAFEKQIKERPLQLLQEKLDKEDEEAEKLATQTDDGTESVTGSQPTRHAVLFDNDHELEYLERHLTLLHKTYYEEYDRKRAAHNTADSIDLTSVPDIGDVLTELKSKVLKGYKIVLTGVLQRGIDIYKSEIGFQIDSFGAQLLPKIRRDMTHLVVNPGRPGRDKLLAARRFPNVKIVSTAWLLECFTRWEAVDETPYLFTARLIDEDRRSGPEPVTEAADPVSDTDETDDGPDKPRKRKILLKVPRLKLVNASGQAQDLGDESDDEDDGEDDDLDEEEEGLLPDEFEDGQLSPLDGLKTFDWGNADAELDEFLASGTSDEDDDDEKGANDKSDQEMDNKDGSDDKDGEDQPDASPSPSKKRKHQEDDTDGAGTGTESERTGDEAGGHGVAKRLRRTKSQRTSSLRNQYVSDADSSLPTPQVTGDEEEVALLKGSQGDDDFDIDEAELEAEMMAELEADAARLAEESVEMAGEKG